MNRRDSGAANPPRYAFGVRHQDLALEPATSNPSREKTEFHARFTDTLPGRSRHRRDAHRLGTVRRTRPRDPLVPRRLRRGVPERAGHDGQVLTPPDLESTRAAVRDLIEAGRHRGARHLLPALVRAAWGVHNDRGTAPSLNALRRNPKGVRFSDLCRVCDEHFGEPRQRGTSHRVYRTPWPGDPRVNIQNDKGMAKAYQVRQVIRAIEKLEGQDV